MKLSIIIPVYNVKEYLSRCIESILKMNLKDFEIILIDDGSSDGSELICDEYSSKYDFIKTYHKENGGASSARNLGINKSNGEFIMFVDSDDFLYDDCNINKIIKNLKYDVIQFKMAYYYENKKKYIKNNELNERVVKKKKSIIDILDNEVIDGTFSISACDKIVRRDLLINNKIFFNENIVGEDIDWSLNLYMYIESMAVFNETLYCYRQSRNNSVTNVISSRNVDSLLYILKKWIYFDYNNSKIKNVYLNYLAYQYLILISCINEKNCDEYHNNEIKKLRFILNYSKNYKVRLCNLILKLLGYRIGVKFFKLYINFKNAGLVKI